MGAKRRERIRLAVRTAICSRRPAGDVFLHRHRAAVDAEADRSVDGPYGRAMVPVSGPRPRSGAVPGVYRRHRPETTALYGCGSRIPQATGDWRYGGCFSDVQYVSVSILLRSLDRRLICNVEERKGASMNQETSGAGARLGQRTRSFLLRVVGPAVLGLAVALAADAQAAHAGIEMGCHRYCNGEACLSTPYGGASCEAGWFSGCTTNRC